MKNREFTNLKNSLAIRAVVKIIFYSIATIIIFSLLVDGVLNDNLANDFSDFNRSLYLWLVRNKILVLGLVYLTIFGVISFIVIRNTNNNTNKSVKKKLLNENFSFLSSYIISPPLN